MEGEGEAGRAEAWGMQRAVGWAEALAEAMAVGWGGAATTAVRVGSIRHAELGL